MARASSIAPQVCAECHAETVADYQRNGMSRSWRRATAGELGLSNESPHVADLVSDYQYQVLAADQAVRQVETRRETKHRLVREAQYFVGSGNHAIAMVTVDNGYLTQMPVAWYRHGEHWQLNPGFELQNHRFDRPITPGCIACHGSFARHQPPTPNKYELPINSGISCERCHGGATEHVAFWSSADTAGDAQRPPQAKLVHPGQLPAGPRNDLCLQCHLQGDVTVYVEGGDPFDFAAGDRLRDHRVDFLIEADQPDTMGVASHGARMLRSRCYTDSGGQLTCLTCHDAHRPTSDFDLAWYDSKCATCHTSQSCSRPSGPERDGSAPACVTCHMPQRSTQEGIHLVFTDHAIPRVRASAADPSPASSLLPPNSAATLQSCWPGDEPAESELGVAYVLLHETVGPQLPALERAVPLLQNALRRNPDDIESGYRLGSALLGLRESRQAIAVLEELLKRDPAHHPARFRLAIACELAGDYDAAIAHYMQLVERVPYWMEPYPRLAQLCLSAQRPGDAVQLLTRQLSFRRNALAQAQLALAKRMNGSSHRSAMASVARSLRLDPRLPTAYLHRGTLHLLIGETESAKADFSRVLELEPGNAQARQALRNLSTSSP